MKKIILLVIIFAATYNNYLSAQLVSFPIRVTDGFAADTMYFGIDPAATNGIDVSLGENELPPVPPTGVFDARFTGEAMSPPVPIGEGLKRDYRTGVIPYNGTIHKHRIKYKVGLGSTIQLSWWNIPLGGPGDVIVAVFRDIILGTLIVKDIIASRDSLLISNPSGFSTLELTVEYRHILPVELSSFTSNVINNNVKLEWITSHESQNSGFGIERKNIYEQIWSEIGFVKGNINSNEYSYYSFNDYNLRKGKYNYRLKQLDLNGNFEYFNLNEVIEIGVPDEFYLSQNFPNPFNPVSTIMFNLPIDAYIKISLYDINGRFIKYLSEGYMLSGYYDFKIKSDGLSSGTYIYRLESQNKTISKKFMILK